MIHRFAMFLGHQTLAMSVVLASLLVGSGEGAVWSERFGAPARRASVGVLFALAALALGLLAFAFLLEGAWSLPLGVRIAIVAAFVGVVGFFLGLPFPAGLGWVLDRHPGAAAWCVGINSFASVLATVLALPIALVSGYSSVLEAGALAYGVALLAAQGFAR